MKKSLLVVLLAVVMTLMVGVVSSQAATVVYVPVDVTPVDVTELDLGSIATEAIGTDIDLAIADIAWMTEILAGNNARGQEFAYDLADVTAIGLWLRGIAYDPAVINWFHPELLVDEETGLLTGAFELPWVIAL